MTVTTEPDPILSDRPRGQQLRKSLHVVTVAWLFGSVYFSSTSGAPITLFAQSMNASPFEFGLLSAMPFIAALLSLPSSILIDKTGKRREAFFATHYTHRLVWIAIAIVPTWAIVNGTGNSVGLYAFLALLFINYCGQAIGGPGWFGWMADVVPDRIRGRYFSRRRSIGIFSAIPAAIITGLILDRFTSPSEPIHTMRICGYVFIVAAIFGVIDIALHQSVPNVRTVPHPQSLLKIFAGPLRNRQFMYFTGFTGTMVFAISFMGQFATLYLIEKLKVTNTQVQLILLVAPSVAQLIILTAWGRAVDRMGRKPVLILASLGFVPIGFGWCFMNTGAIWLGYLLASLGAALWAGVEVANSNLVLELSGSDKGTSSTTYFAVNNVVNNLAGALGGIASGVVAQSLKDWSYDLGVIGLAPIGFYEVLFAMSGMLRLLAVVVFLPIIHEPTARPTAETLRFMTVNIYNNLHSAVTAPFRVIQRPGRTRTEQAA